MEPEMALAMVLVVELAIEEAAMELVTVTEMEPEIVPAPANKVSRNLPPVHHPLPFVKHRLAKTLINLDRLANDPNAKITVISTNTLGQKVQRDLSLISIKMVIRSMFG
jgi:hypothetical protein